MNLILVRGLPGSGKSTFAQTFALTCTAANQTVAGPFEADQFFINKETNVYEFDAALLGHAHGLCFRNTEDAMQKATSTVIVSNTFTTQRELKPYLELAAKYNYQVTSLVVENRHGNSSVHNVPDEALDKMQNRFAIQLR